MVSAMDLDDRKLLEEVLEVAKELLEMFREYEPLLKTVQKVRSPSSIWKH
jgi:hypothetical protein